MKRLCINVFFDESTILKILIVYRTAIARHLLGLLEGRLMYYEPIPTVTKHICHIIVPTSLHHIIFNLVYTTLVDWHMGKYKTLHRIQLRFFSLGYILMFLTGSRSVPTVCSRIVRDNGDRKYCILGLIDIHSLSFILICSCPVTIQIETATWLIWMLCVTWSNV